MNIHQARGVVTLLEQAAKLTGRDEKDMHLGWGREIVRADVDQDDDELDGNVEVTIWRGGIGTMVMLDNDGGAIDPDAWNDCEHVPVRLALREDGTFTTEASDA